MYHYVRRIAIPVILEVVFIISCFVLPRHLFVYSNTAFFVALLGYIIATKSVSMHQWYRALADGRHFWRQVVITLVCAAEAFGATSLLEQAFPHLTTGAITMPVKTAGELLLFALSTIVLPAIVEETIFRKRMICLANRTAIICTTLLSAMLFAAEHFVAPWGVLLGMVWALPFSLAYSMTRTNDGTCHCEHTHQWTDGGDGAMCCVMMSTLRILRYVYITSHSICFIMRFSLMSKNFHNNYIVDSPRHSH